MYANVMELIYLYDWKTDMQAEQITKVIRMICFSRQIWRTYTITVDISQTTPLM